MKMEDIRATETFLEVWELIQNRIWSKFFIFQKRKQRSEGKVGNGC